MNATQTTDLTATAHDQMARFGAVAISIEPTSPTGEYALADAVNEAWICVCGNDDFMFSDVNGNEVEPTNEWTEHHTCNGCDRVIDQKTVRANPAPTAAMVAEGLVQVVDVVRGPGPVTYR